MQNSVLNSVANVQKQYKSTLEREGIKAATSSAISGSKFGRSKPTLHKARAQQSLDDHLPDRKLSSLGTNNKKISDIVDSGSSHHDFLPRTQWINLGDGWFQTTPLGTGSTTRCGLHSVIESSLGQFFMCLYEPRSHEAITACTSNNPEYDLEIYAKILTKPTSVGINPVSKKQNYSFQIVFGFKSATEFCSLKCDERTKCWQISHTTRGEEHLLRQIPDDNIKANVFYHMLIQIRGSSLSVDVNGTPIVTSIRMSERDGMGGLMGLFSKGTKFVVKGWKLKGLSSSINSNKSVISSTEVMTPSSSSSSYSLLTTNGDTSAVTRSVFSSFANVRTSNDSNATSMTVSSAPTPKKTVSLMDALRAKNGAAASGNGINNINTTGNIRNEPVTNVTAASAIAAIYKEEQDSSYRNNNSNVNRSESSDHDHDITHVNNNIAYTDQVLASCAQTLSQSHDRGIVDTVMRDVVQRDLGVTFEDIASLHTAKRLLNEAVVLPLIMPEFFTGIREPWKGVLLFGPPGTGKTLLAKAVCSFNSSTFFSCSSSSLISKYRGESEKIVRCLFEAARLCAPSIVFLDEIDALVSSRGDNEHEASRRLKTEIFSQMDGLASTKSVNETNKSVMVLATTNCPWDLDDALRRRLEKRIYIPLPDLDSRAEIFRICLRDIPLSFDVSIDALAQLSDGYSGSDVYTACKDAAMMPMRRMLVMLSPADIVSMKQSGDITVPKVTLEDFRQAIVNTKPSVASGTIGRYEAWEKEFSNR